LTAPFAWRRDSSSPVSDDRLETAFAESLPGLLGLEWTNAEPGVVRGRMAIKRHHMAPNGFLHAASVIALADSACGRGAFMSRPEGATGFTTIELKTNFLGTAVDGAIVVEARLIHGGKMTQVWDAEVRKEGADKPLALFRCTQMMLYPR
jgi:1,4-dihydroxy-2-naphthoyl-CoA hydrolase